MTYSAESIRAQFPILNRTVHGKPLVYLDNGATTQKPLSVIEAVNEVYLSYNSNIHRGVHHLSNVCTDAFEQARQKVQRWIGAAHGHEIIFTRGTTESINLVAASFGETFLKRGDEVVVSVMEHHANIVPWQMLETRIGIVLKVIPVNQQGELMLETLPELFTARTRLVAIAHVSNVMGTVNPIAEIIRVAHSRDIPVLVDAAQSIQHLTIDVQQLDCDFLAFSGHKMYAPTGIGVLYGKEKWLNQMNPWQGGGEMIERVSFEKTTFNALPFKFEAGTPDYAGAVGLGVAIDFLTELGISRIAAHEKALHSYAIGRLEEVEELRWIGRAAHHASVLSFLVGNIHPFDMGAMLDKMGIAVRTGHHCAQPLMQHYRIQGTVRASFALYNTFDEVDRLVEGIQKIRKLLG